MVAREFDYRLSAHSLAFSRQEFRPSDASSVSLRKERAQGMPGAGRTRSPVWEKNKPHQHSHYR
jgi:hypothetical protein